MVSLCKTQYHAQPWWIESRCVFSRETCISLNKSHYCFAFFFLSLSCLVLFFLLFRVSFFALLWLDFILFLFVIIAPYEGVTWNTKSFPKLYNFLFALHFHFISRLITNISLWIPQKKCCLTFQSKHTLDICNIYWNLTLYQYETIECLELGKKAQHWHQSIQIYLRIVWIDNIYIRISMVFSFKDFFR